MKSSGTFPFSLSRQKQAQPKLKDLYGSLMAASVLYSTPSENNISYEARTESEPMSLRLQNRTALVSSETSSSSGSKFDVIISPKSGYTTTSSEAVLSPANNTISTLGSSTTAASDQPPLPPLTTAVVPLNDVSHNSGKDSPPFHTEGVKSPSMLSYSSWYINAGGGAIGVAPPYQNSYDEVWQFIYTNEKGPLIKHLDDQFDNIFSCIGNVYFLGIHTGASSFATNSYETKENGVYEVIISWLMDKKLVRKLWAHENWNHAKVTQVFVVKLCMELKDRQRSYNGRSLNRRADLLYDVISEEEFFVSILKWSRSEDFAGPRKMSGFKIKESWKVEEMLQLISFQAIPKENLLAFLDEYADSNSSNTALFKLDDETIKTVIRLAFDQYEQAKQPQKRPRWISTLLNSLKKK
jgi:hypothetical protein